MPFEKENSMYQKKALEGRAQTLAVGNRLRHCLKSMLCLVVLVTSAVAFCPRQAAAATLPAPSHSTTIALAAADQVAVVVNREANSLSLIAVRNLIGQDIAVKLAEVAVGLEPRCVAVNPNNTEAYVTNA